jgi:hypothetical protein
MELWAPDPTVHSTSAKIGDRVFGSDVDAASPFELQPEVATPVDESALRCVVVANNSNSMAGRPLAATKAVLRFILPRLSRVPTRIIVLGSSAKRFDGIPPMAGEEGPFTSLGAAFAEWSAHGGMGRVVPHLSNVATAKDVAKDASIIILTDGASQLSGDAPTHGEETWLGTSSAYLNRMHSEGFTGRIHVLVALNEGPSQQMP